MNPLLQAALGSFVRWGLALGAGYIVKAGIWTRSDAEIYITAATLAILSIGWSVWQKYRARLKQVMSMKAPRGTTDTRIEVLVSEQTLAEKVTLAVSPKS